MAYETFALERWMTTWELDVDYDIAESGILPLSLNDLYELLSPETRDSLERELHEMPLGYGEARGTIGLRTALANTYARATPDDILVTTGAIEANFLLFNTLLEAGDHVVAVAPAYQQLQSVPRALGAEVDLWSVVQENGFAYDLNVLESLVRDNTKLIVINSPHNPTGAMMDAEQLAAVVRRGIPLAGASRRRKTPRPSTRQLRSGNQRWHAVEAVRHPRYPDRLVCRQCGDRGPGLGYSGLRVT
jgi:aspartate/methionine/tyrosine aminotransferase